MIHSVRLPEQDKMLLLKMVDFQKAILALATARNSAFSDDGQEIRDHFETLLPYQACGRPN
jgi:hypothetical protein